MAKKHNNQGFWRADSGEPGRAEDTSSQQGLAQQLLKKWGFTGLEEGKSFLNQNTDPAPAFWGNKYEKADVWGIVFIFKQILMRLIPTVMNTEWGDSIKCSK